MGPKCQSCGMPLSKDPQGGGSQADGGRSTRYCSLCYENGAFRHPDASLEEFQSHCVDALVAKGMPRILAWAFTRGMGKLDRWRSAG